MAVPDPRTVTSMPDFLLGVGWTYRIIYHYHRRHPGSIDGADRGSAGEHPRGHLRGHRQCRQQPGVDGGGGGMAARPSGQKGHTMRRVITGLVLVLFLLRPAEGGEDLQLTADSTRQILRGTDHMGNLNYAEAREAFGQLKNLPGGDLLSPFLEGLVDMDQAVQEDRGEEEFKGVLDRFLARMEPVVMRGEALLQATPDNADLMLALGMIRGVKGGGDGEGTLAAVPAAVTLTRILSGWEEQYAEALPYAELLAARYPGNPEFLFLLAFLYSEAHQTTQALSVAEAIRIALEQRHPHFPSELTPRYLQLRGKIAMDAGPPEEALAFFRQAIEQRNAKFA